MKTIKTPLLIALLSVFILPILAQESEQKQLYRITLTDKSQHVGEIDSETGTSITLINPTSGIRTELPNSLIQKKEALANNTNKKNAYWFPNPNSSRYLFGPSAFNLKKGEGYYQNTLLLLNSVNVGVTDYFSIGGGVEFLSTFISLSQGNFTPIVYLTPKFGINVSENIALGGGVLLASIPEFGSSENVGLGLAYGLATYGNLDHNLTATIGYAWVENNTMNKPVITLSGMTRIGKKTALVTENWLVPNNTNYEPIFSYGIRFFGETIAVDLAFINNWDIAQQLIIGIPYINFVVKF